MSIASTGYRVVLFGWLQARSRHLAKYEQVWLAPPLQAKEVHVFRSNLPVLLSPRLSGNRLDRLAQQIERPTSHATSTNDDGLVIHLMSNGGALACGEFFSRFASDAGERTLFGRPVRGIVFDSCPGILTAQMAADGIIASGGMDDGVALYLVDPLRALFRSYLGMPSTNQRVERAFRGLENMCPGAPRLFLYSKADRIIPYQNVESFIARERQLGRAVSVRRWEDTPHVQLLRYHPEEYTAELQRIVGLETVKES